MSEYTESDWLPNNSPMKKGYIYNQTKLVNVYKDAERLQVTTKQKVVINTDDITKHLYIRKDTEIPEVKDEQEQYFRKGVYRVFKYDTGSEILNAVFTLDNDNQYLLIEDEDLNKWYDKLED